MSRKQKSSGVGQRVDELLADLEAAKSNADIGKAIKGLIRAAEDVQRNMVPSAPRRRGRA